MAEINGTTPIGEIVEVSTTGFTAQCLTDPRPATPCLFDPPDFGSFVKIGGQGRNGSHELPQTNSGEEEDPFASQASLLSVSETRLAPNTAFALVCHARMSSLDPTRRAGALGYADEAELLAHQPQLAELITTEFSGLLVAFTDEEGRLHRRLPARPPRIHSRVSECEEQEVRSLTADLGFLRPILAPVGGPQSAVPQDELVAAALRTAWSSHGRSQDYLLRAGKKILELLADDYGRLQAIMGSLL
jgi:hypothetical protein